MDAAHDPIVVVGYARTPVCEFGESFADVPAESLGAVAAEAALERAGLSPVDVDEWIIGTVGPSASGRCMSRLVAVEAGGLPSSTAIDVSRQCGASMHAVMIGAHELLGGGVDVVVTGGVENMTREALHDEASRVSPSRSGRLSPVLDRAFHTTAMGLSAEQIAERYRLSRQDQDVYAAESQRRAQEALDDGTVEKEIVPLLLPFEGEGELLVDTDEHPRADITVEKLSALEPIYATDGTVTSGNTCGVNDAGSALVLMRSSAARRRRLQPLAELIDFARVSQDPERMAWLPSPAVDTVLGRNGIRPQELAWVELHESFAASALATIRESRLDDHTVNPLGGAIAWGHPVGATGAIITARTIANLDSGQLGLATMPLDTATGVAGLWRGL
ncbi:thiolase family protein [Austwickia chelonae]|uniref:thiolase family protein n=1 Tax=Austwickia chelonae TaxID=100225 RepID=UPI000E21E164|nr:thiolase family protein [Austwickia chelonae]